MKHRVVLLLFVLTSSQSVHLAVAPFASQAAQDAATPLDFVRATEASLLLTGKPLQLFGVNHADLVWSFIWPGSIPENGTVILEEAARCNITVVRYSAFGYFSWQVRTWIENKAVFWSGYDRLIKTAGKLGIYLIPTLLWNPKQFSEAVGEQHPDVFSEGAASNELFKSLAKELVTRYRNETAILMWEIGNELNLLVKPRTDYYSLQELRSFIKDIVGLIKGIDKNHLVGSGMAAPPHDINPTLDDAVNHFTAVNDFLDVTSIHTYPGEDQNGPIYGMTETEYIRLFYETAAQMNKPLMIGEFGDNLEINPHSSFCIEVLAAAFSLKIPLALMWEWMVPPDRDPSTRLIWSIDPHKTPFMTSVLQRFSVAAQMETFGTQTITKMETATKTLTVETVIKTTETRIAWFVDLIVVALVPTLILAVVVLRLWRRKPQARNETYTPSVSLLTP